MAHLITRSRHGRLQWLQQGLGAVAVMGLVSCAGMEDEGEKLAPTPDQPEAPVGGETPAGTEKAAPYEQGELLVRFKNGVGISSAYSVHSKYQAQLVRAYKVPSNLHLVKVSPNRDIEKMIELYRSEPNVLYAEPNYRYQLTAVPNDPMLNQLWGMNNTGQTGGLADADINAFEAWDVTTGSANTIIGVLDTGFDYNHEDLAANAFVNPGEIAGNGVDDDANGFVDDIHGINSVIGNGDPMDDLDHGTHVSGTIAGVGNNGIGVAGVNWTAKIVACEAFSAAGATIDDILVCMEYFLDLKTRAQNPVNIVATNNSWGGGGFSQALYDSINAHKQAGMLFVAAAGNSNNNNDASAFFPATYDLDNIISVLATTHQDTKASFSSFGARTVDVGAPGQDIVSTIPGNLYDSFNGTSMATPHVTGLVGLLKTQNPARTSQQIKNLILTGGQVTPATATTVLSGRRIRADGSLNCSNQVLTNRFAPAGNSIVVGTGTPIPLGVLSINCDQPNPNPQTVTVSPGGQVINLNDPTGTGRFEGVFTPQELGTFTLTFSNGDVVTVATIGNYDPPVPAPFECRTISGTRLTLSDDSSAPVTSPFPIRFAGATPGLSTLHVSSNGTISLSNAFSSFSNSALPTSAVETLIAVFWDDLNPGTSGGGQVSFATVGAAPNRELVVEWKDVPHFSRVGAATFQAVFFENSPNILLNYCDVMFENASFDRGASATVGVQVTRQVARQFSFNTASLQNGTALLFGMGAPQAVAGPDQVVLPGTPVTLNGNASRDFDGTIVSHAWTQTAGEPVTLNGANTATPSFTAPQTPGTLTFQLTVTDDDGQTGTDSVDVIVNLPPVADAGRDYELATNLTGVLDGTNSFDPDGVVVGYRWTQLNGDPVVITNAETPIATFVAPPDPQYLVFELTVTDEYGFTGRDVVVVEVFFNGAPVADAGDDRIVRPGSTVTLDGSRSSDRDGTIASYAWNVDLCITVAGPCTVELTGADAAVAQFTAPDSVGLVQVTLTVTDDIGAVATDTVILGVFRQAPKAIATAGEGCASSGNTVTLDGSFSFDPDGTIVSYQWVQVAGAPVNLEGADTPVATFVAPATGETLSFELTVTDDDGLRDTVRIDVPVNTPPVADARASAVAVLAGQTVTLDATNSTDAATYLWEQIAGTPTQLSDATSPTPTFVAQNPSGPFDLVTFRLTVTDECGSTSTDTITIVVVRVP